MVTRRYFSCVHTDGDCSTGLKETTNERLPCHFRFSLNCMAKQFRISHRKWLIYVYTESNHFGWCSLHIHSHSIEIPFHSNNGTVLYFYKNTYIYVVYILASGTLLHSAHYFAVLLLLRNNLWYCR